MPSMRFREKARIMDRDGLRRVLVRIAHEIVERNQGTGDLIIVGIKNRGVPLASRIAGVIRQTEGVEVPTGSLDTTLYRDDIGPRERRVVNSLSVPMDVHDKSVVLVDDVLYTGRTIRAAMDALIDMGRPRLIQLAVVVDRGHRELPIRPDFVGKNVPTSKKEVVDVLVDEVDGEDGVVIREIQE
jgi:pyrimidine operon attenuation protein/uracil phosphoribosyltransferase